MKLVNVKMSETQKLQVEDLASTLGVTSSTVMRALILDGIKRTNAQASRDLKEATDHIKLLDAKAKL